MNQYTREEVSKHNKASDCWIVIDSRVYDVTSFLESHPGGAERLLSVAGKDATDAFQLAQHSDAVLRQRGIQFEIGSIIGENSVDALPPFPEEDDSLLQEQHDESGHEYPDVDDVERMSVISVHSNLPDASPPAPDDSEDMSFESLRQLMPFGIPDAALREEINRLNKAGVLEYGHLSCFTLEELEKIVKPTTARTLRHYLKNTKRPSQQLSPTTTKVSPQSDLTVGLLRQLGGGMDLTLDEEVSKLRSKGVLVIAGLAQFSMEDMERMVRPATAKVLKPYLKRPSTRQLSLPHGAHIVGADERPLTLALLRSLFPQSVPESAVQDELTKLNQASISTLEHLAQRSAEDLAAIVRPGTVRALGKYLKGDMQIITEPTQTRTRSADLSEQLLDLSFLRTLLPSGIPEPAIMSEINSLSNAGLTKVVDLNTKSGDELDKIVKLATSRALRPFTRDAMKSPSANARSSLTVTSYPSSEELSLAFLKSVLPDAPTATLEEELDKLRSAAVITLGDIRRFKQQDLEKVVSAATARTLISKLDPFNSTRPITTAFLATVMPGVPEGALIPEVAKLQAHQITSVEQLEMYTPEELEKFGMRVAAVKALRPFTKGNVPPIASPNAMADMISPALSARGGMTVPGLALDSWMAPSEVSMAFLRSCMPGVPDAPLQEELNKLRNHKIVTVGNLSSYTVEEMEKLVKSSTARAMARFLKNPPPPRGMLSPNMGAQPSPAVPSLALETFPPYTEINMLFLRRILPAGIPDAALHEELSKLHAKGVTTVGTLSHFTLQELEGIVKVGTARMLIRYRKEPAAPPKGVISPTMRGLAPGESLPPLLLASIFPTTEITTTFLRPLMPESQAGAVQDEVLKLRSRNINTVGLLANYSLQEMERIVLPATARALSTFLKQAHKSSGVISPTLGGARGGVEPIPQLALEAKAPTWADISVSFLRTVMPQNIPESALQEEAFKLRMAGITTVGQLANYTVEELERIVRVPTARSLPRYLKPSSNMIGGLLSPEQRAAQSQQFIPSFQLDRMKVTDANVETFAPHAEVSIALLRSVMPGVPDPFLTEELNKLFKHQIRKVSDLSFHTVEDLQNVIRPATSRALARYLRNGAAGAPINIIASPTMAGMQPSSSAYLPPMSLQPAPPSPQPQQLPPQQQQQRNNSMMGLPKQPAPAPPLPVVVAPAPPPVDPNQELNITFLRTMLPAGVPEAALQDEISKLRDNFILSVGNLADYSQDDLERISLKLGTIRALKLYVKGGTAATTGSRSSALIERSATTNGEQRDAEISAEFLASVMPKGVPENALHTELAKLKLQMICTLYHLSFFTLEEMEKIVRLTTARSLREYLKGGSIKVPPPIPPPVKEEVLPALPEGPPWTDKHPISVAFLRTVMPPGMPDDPLKDEIVKLNRNKICTIGELGTFTTEEITKLAGMSGWFLKDYAKEGSKCLYVPPPAYVPDPDITLDFMKALMPPGIPDALILDDMNKLIAANIVTVPDLGLKTTDEVSKLVGMSGWFLKDYLKGGPKMLAPNPKPPPEELKFTDGPEQELTGPFLKTVLPFGIPEEAPEEEAKKFRNAGILNLGQLAQYAPKEMESIVRILTVRSLAKFMRPPLVVSPLSLLKQVSPTMGATNLEDEITVSFLRSRMPAGVPNSALQEEVSKLHNKGIWTVGNLGQYSLADMEQIVRATTARSLKEYLANRRTSVARRGSPSIARASVVMAEGDTTFAFTGSSEVSVAFLRSVMPGGVPEAALLEEVAKIRAKGINTLAQLSMKTLAEMENIVRVTTARSLRDYLKPSSSPQPSPQPAPQPTSQPRPVTPGGAVDWGKEEISLAFLRAMMPAVPDAPLQEEVNNLRNKAILRVSQLQQYTDYELGQIVRAATVRAVKAYLRGGTAIAPPAASINEISSSTEISLSAFQSLMPTVPEGPLQEEVTKLRNRGVVTFGHLSQYTQEEFGRYAKPGTVRALARFLRSTNSNPAAALAPLPPVF